MPNGLLILDKPAGMTSHDVVNFVRRQLRIRRVGHTGTLDPLATGVLLVLVGPATRLAQFITAERKSYRAVIRLGEATTTYDAEGGVTARQPVNATRDAVAAALAGFQGAQTQIPPMYSAIKIQGQTLYKLARQGQEIERPARDVTFSRLELRDWTSPDATVDVDCSAGTYIRSLAHDLGQTLGCGAHLRALTRTAVGPFTLAQARSLEEVAALAETGALAEAVISPSAALPETPAVSLDAETLARVRHGQTVTLDAPAEAGLLKALDAAGHLVALLVAGEAGQWQPKLVLPETA